MTHLEKDREAFKKWLQNSPIDYHDRFVREAAQHGWQAARDHYAPKLTQVEAMRFLFEFHRKAAADDCGLEIDELLTFEESRDSADEDERTPYLNAAGNIEALRIAGVRFKDDGAT
jgi:hypothetical protein